MEDFSKNMDHCALQKNVVVQSSFECISDLVEGKTCRCNQFVKTTALLTEHVDKKAVLEYFFFKVGSQTYQY